MNTVVCVLKPVTFSSAVFFTHPFPAATTVVRIVIIPTVDFHIYFEVIIIFFWKTKNTSGFVTRVALIIPVTILVVIKFAFRLAFFLFTHSTIGNSTSQITTITPFTITNTKDGK